MRARVRSFYFRLYLAFLISILCLGVSQYIVLHRVWNKASQETDQRLHWKLAEDIRQVLQPYLAEPQNLEGLRLSMSQLQRMNPKIDIFVLDASGTIISYLPVASSPLLRQNIDTAEIKQLTEATLPQFPAYGPDPRSAAGVKIFSAAPIRLGSGTGFIYVPLEGPGDRTYLQLTERINLMAGSSLTTVILIGIAALLGLILFFFLTRRFRILAEIVHNYAQGDLSRRIDATQEDELGQLGREFNQMADTIVEKIAQLEHTDKLRRELTAHVSHDLGGPLSSVRGYLETYLSKHAEYNEDQKIKCVDVALKNVNMLARLTDDMFELSKLEAHDVVPQRQAFSLREIITEHVISSAAPRARQKEIDLAAEIEPSLPSADGDPEMIERVLSNLVNNAINYSNPSSKVTISARLRGGKIQVAVADTGPGIDPADLPRIFDEFYRGGRERTSGKKGTGLGLAIVKRMLEAHGEKIAVTSELGAGTTFSFELAVFEHADRSTLT